jgi:hypothetical protein
MLAIGHRLRAPHELVLDRRQALPRLLDAAALRQDEALADLEAPLALCELLLSPVELGQELRRVRATVGLALTLFERPVGVRELLDPLLELRLAGGEPCLTATQLRRLLRAGECLPQVALDCLAARALVLQRRPCRVQCAGEPLDSLRPLRGPRAELAETLDEARVDLLDLPDLLRDAPRARRGARPASRR